MNKRPTCYMLIGLPAAGKSTYRDTMRGQVLSTDDFVHDYARKEGRTYSEVFKEAMPGAEKNLRDDLLTAVENSWDIIWDQTNLTAASRKKKLAKIPDHYDKVAVYIVPPPEDVWRDRLARRTFQPIPENILRSMQKQFEFPTKSEGFHEIQVVDYCEEKRNWC